MEQHDLTDDIFEEDVVAEDDLFEEETVDLAPTRNQRWAGPLAVVVVVIGLAVVILVTSVLIGFFVNVILPRLGPIVPLQ